MAKYKAYPEYKDSGVEWLGEVPLNWQIHSLKRAVEGCTNGVWGGEPDDKHDLIVLRVADFDRQSFKISDLKLTTRSILPKDRGSRLLKQGDLLIEKSGGGDKTLVGCVVLFDKKYEAVTSNFVAKMTPRDSYDGHFLTYAFSQLYAGKVNYPSIKQTTGIQNLDADSYLMEKFCFPPKHEQRNIACFLDHETAKIDNLIEKQQQLIELLKEKRQAVISLAVTKGLNPDVPMKDSGVEWLGDVPEHWGITKLKWVGRTTSGGTPTTSKFEIYYEDGHIPWIRTTDLNNGELFDTPIRITSKAVNDTACSILPVGSVLLGMYGGAGSIGKHAILRFESTINQAVCGVLPCGRILPDFLHKYYEFYRPFWMIDAAGTRKDPNIGQDNIKEGIILIPPFEEQVEINNHIDNMRNIYECIIENALEGMDLLQERRTALISAAVTGKIDVRDWVAPETQDVEEPQEVTA
ncbi:restriction endonuclease subunit S [Enterobacter asburiae]|uniref:restriction endonuclease subunit S n=1 Tax=Enterobacter cloacae complex TaxID=354276 RepID=UPI0005DECC1E|nr:MULTISPECIES: restriction endonuclease subunit S [Enterobacter cloacae complex]KJI88645.1 hypothetical protein UO97_02000 [Enterobacter asburiae]MDV5191291.1 restriction endonuclease subunit S [Enterobacter asburiae]MDV5267493.1 restriction endonuclease subunit S [Enterobacter asburiae]MEB8256565.1 restriction endonuclease subunit S [Enterobacter asburiae]OAZ89882.1 hypothetical protein A9X61_21340 [Enterobacter asburiae]